MPEERKITIKGKPATVQGTSVFKNGKYVGQVGTENLVPDKNNLKPSKADLRADAKKKAITTKKGPIYKESSKQEEKNLLMEDPVDNRAATMKKGPFYKTDARIARDYAANAVYDTKHGKKSEAKFEKKKLMHIVNSIAGPRSRG